MSLFENSLRFQQSTRAGTSIITVAREGARLQDLEILNTKVLTAPTRGDGKDASTHLCTPIFGPETTTSYGIAQHGDFRNQTHTPRITEMGFGFSSNIDDGTLPKGASVDLIYRLSPYALTITTTYFNSGSVPVPINSGVHFYWYSPEGWDGLVINGNDVTQRVKDDDIIPLKSTNLIKIPGRPEYLLRQFGLNCANLWAYRDPETGEYDQHYVAIEPVERDPKTNPFGSADSLLLPRSFRQTIVDIEINPYPSTLFAK